MQDIPQKNIPAWGRQDNFWCPTAVDVNCPHCNRLTTIPLSVTTFDPKSKVINTRGRCPACGKMVNVVVVNPNEAAKEKGASAVAIHPSPRQPRQPIVDDCILPARIYRAYLASVDSYNSSLWAPAISACRRTLEGIASEMLPEQEREGMLGQQLKKLPNHVDLSKPILALADSLRKGGNVGAHFDLEKEPNEEVARLVLELLEYFIEYVYVFPEHAICLEQRLEKLGGD